MRWIGDMGFIAVVVLYAIIYAKSSRYLSRRYVQARNRVGAGNATGLVRFGSMMPPPSGYGLHKDLNH
jgi:hypothetical protein